MTPSTQSRRPPVGLMIAVLFVVAALVLGYVIGRTQGQKSGYAAGQADLRKTIESRLPDTPQAQDGAELHSISGTVTETRSDGFVISIQQLVTNPLSEPAPLTRTVRVTAGTKITLLKTKDAAAYRAEADAFRAAQAAGTGASTVPPSPYSSSEAQLADIQAGMTVFVTAASDITYASTIEATEVSAQQATVNETPPLVDPGVVTDPDAAGTPEGGAPTTPGTEADPDAPTGPATETPTVPDSNADAGGESSPGPGNDRPSPPMRFNEEPPATTTP